MNTVQLSLAGLALSLGVLYANLRPWWKGGRDPKGLIPFGEGFVLGALSTVCTGGLLGWLSGCTAQGANTAGDKVVSGTTGSEGGALARGSLGQLTPEGGVVVFLITVGVVIAWKAAAKLDKRRIVGGAFVGATLCLTAGVAGALGWLPDTVNAVGDWGRGFVEGAGVL